MAILNRFFRDSTRLRFESFFCFSLRSFWQFQARDSENRAIRDSRFRAAKGRDQNYGGSGKVVPGFFRINYHPFQNH